MDRVACWLLDQIGEGCVFTTEELRREVPDRSQVDRRMRELRDYGWRIDEKRDDNSLLINERRFVECGIAVWVRGERAKAGVATVSDKIRQRVFKRDGHSCVRCGIASREYFDDRSGVRARLTLAHKYPQKYKRGAGAGDFVTACQRCNESLRQHTDVYRDGIQVAGSIRELKRSDKIKFLAWVKNESRPRSRIDEVWAEYWQLSASERDQIKVELETVLFL